MCWRYRGISFCYTAEKSELPLKNLTQCHCRTTRDCCNMPSNSLQLLSQWRQVGGNIELEIIHLTTCLAMLLNFCLCWNNVYFISSFPSDRDILGTNATKEPNGACSVRNGNHSESSKEQWSLLTMLADWLQIIAGICKLKFACAFDLLDLHTATLDSVECWYGN